MATTTRDLLIAISVDGASAAKDVAKVKDAVSQLSSSASNVSNSFNSMEQSVKGSGDKIIKEASSIESSVGGIFNKLSGFGATAIGLNSVFQLFDRFKGGVESLLKPVEMAGEAEQTMARLGAALKLTGQDSEDAMSGIQSFAQNLQKVGGVSQEAVKSVISLNLALGFNVKQAEYNTEAAAGLAKLTGTDLVSANEQLSGSLGGMTRGLSRVVPGIRSITTAALQQAAAYETVHNATQSFLVADAKTSLGALDRLGLGWDDLKKQVGSYVLAGLNAAQNFDTLSQAIDDLGTFFRDNSDTIAAFAGELSVNVVHAVKALGEAIKEFGPILVPLSKQVGDLTKYFLLPFADAFVIINSAIAHFSGNTQLEKGLDNLHDKIEQAHTDARNALEGINAEPPVDWDKRLNTEGLQASIEAQKGLFEGMKDSYESNIQKNFADLATQQAKAMEQSKSNLEKWKELWDKAAGLFKATPPIKVEPPHPQYFDVGPSKLYQQMGPDKANMMPKVDPEAQKKANAFPGKYTPQLSREQQEQQIQAQKALTEQRLAIEDSYGNELVAARNVSIRKIDEAEQQAARQGITVTQQATALKEAINAKFADDMRKATLKDAQLAASMSGDVIAQNKARYGEDVEAASDAYKKKHLSLDQYTAAIQNAGSIQEKADREYLSEVAVATDDLFKANQLSYDQDLANYQDFLDKKLISSEQYDKAVAAANVTKKLADSSATEKPFSDTASELGTSVVSPVLGGIGKVLDAVKSLIEFIPTILEKVADIFKSITSLPLDIANAFNDVTTAVLKFVQSFLPNIITAVEKIMTSVVQFVEQLPKVFSQLMKQLPEMIKGLMDQLPQMTEDLVRSLTNGLPEIFSSLLNMLITKAPGLIIESIRQSIIDIPKAVAEGIIKGLEDIPAIISGSFKGLGDTAATSLATGFARAISGVTTQSSKLFSVIDASATAQGINSSKAIADAIESATNRASSVMGALWKDLENLWNYVAKSIIQPFLTMLSSIWNSVYQNNILPLINGLQNVWSWVNDTVLKPLNNIVSTAFQWVVDHVLAPISGVVSTAFGWVGTNIFTPMASVVANAFGFVKTIFNSIASAPGWVTQLGSSVTGLTSNFAWASTFSSAVTRLGQGFGFVTDFTNAVNKLSTLTIGGSSSSAASGGVQSVVHSVTSALGFATGGMIPHYAAAGLMIPRGNDTVPIMAQPGEFMLRKRAVTQIGASTVASINATGKLPPTGPQTINLGGINISNNGKNVDAAFIKQTIVPIILAELKTASVNGRFVASTKGLRNV